MVASSLHLPQVAGLVVAAALLIFGLFRAKPGDKRLAAICVGAALALFGVFTEVFGFWVRYVALFGNAHWSVGFWAGPAGLELFTLRPATVEQFPWLPDALQWSALVLTPALGAGAGLAFALKAEQDAQQREEAQLEGGGPMGAASQELRTPQGEGEHARR